MVHSSLPIYRAVLAIQDWRFRPALRNGVPVPVFYNLTVRFSLQ